MKIVLFGFLLSMVSCRYEELCYDHEAHALSYHVCVDASYDLHWEYPHEHLTDWKKDWPDWYAQTYEELNPTEPAGLRITAYENNEKFHMANLPAKGGAVRLRQEQSLLFYNNDTEYILFHDLDHSISASATTRTRTRVSFKGNPLIPSSRTEQTMTPPDILFSAYIPSYVCEKKPANEKVVLSADLKPLVFKYLVRYEFSSGLEYVALGRGAMTGMAASVYLTDGHTAPESATVLYDCELKDYGIEAVVTSFGIPDFPNSHYGPTKGQGIYGLNLEVKLRNGLLKTFNFDITDQVVKQPHGGVIVVSGIQIDKKDGEQGGGGFDVEVDDWGEVEDVILPL